MTNPIYYLDPEDFASLTPGSSFLLEGPEAHHAKTVKRAQLGEELDLADGQGQRATCRVRDLPAEGLLLEVLSLAAAPEGLSLYLVQALAKADRDLLALEMATELGVSGIIPWSADRSIVRWKGQRAEKALNKWQNTARAAAKQSRRALIPEVYDQHSTQDLAALARQLGPTALFLVLHEQATSPLSKVLEGRNLADLTEIYCLVGPEGGISPQELDQLTAAGAQPILLGPEVLRSSTAGAAALSALNLLLGRW